MLEVAIMIEGQDGIGWDRWKRPGLAVEDLGYAGLHRSSRNSRVRPGGGAGSREG
jgi:hypothetical protein